MSLVRLHLRDYPGPAESTPILLVHGLFGSGANWHGIARRLAQTRPVLVPDVRNHGESPWDAEMDYPAMAADLAAVLDGRGIEGAHLVGHSMGGKAAMCLALAQPERVRSLTVVDIAPIAYESRFGTLVEALQALPLEDLRDRRDADARLAAVVSSAAVRGYLLQNLAYDAVGGLRWRVNLPVLAASLGQILGFPDGEGRQFAGPTLFAYGSRSDYVGAEGLARIRALFPLARLRSVPNAGHWVYADQPDAFLAALTGFLKD
jgi:pimeloyl-ACP methyl ester carboxylesterase